MKQIDKQYQENICKNCFGKGYSTQLYGYRYSADFIGDKVKNIKPTIHINICKCQRGKDLNKYFSVKEEIYLEIKELFVKSVGRRNNNELV